MTKPLVGIIMGSNSDLDVMAAAAETLEKFGVAHEVQIISAHRTPDEMRKYGQTARGRGIKVIIAGAGGSAHLPGMTAAFSQNVPVLAVPVKRPTHDHEALWSNVKMPPGVPLATMPENGAYNAALLAVQILATSDAKLAKKYLAFHEDQKQAVIKLNQKVKKDWRSQLPEAK